MHYKVSEPDSKGAAPMAPVSSDWSPPACWYEPRYTPKQFEKYLISDDYGPSSGGRDMEEQYGKDDYHKGDKGIWYQLVGHYVSDPASYGACAENKDSYLFVGPAHPAPPYTPVIDPKILAGLAYNRTKLPAPPVKLSPDADHQIVNLATYASFTRKLNRVWVTASLNEMGVNVAATTVATPTKLRIDAGTDEADPQSCTYDLKKQGSSYAVNSKGAGCNVTYRRTSGHRTYPLRASLTWKVIWTASADPNGPVAHPALPDGQSTREQDVTVKEIQSVTR